ncbi:hypothetical protein [Petrotoga sp. 9PWA.NaAc.5.4]|uniref:hypothetical protein n=1 Tax=Petrotoga sp. 9PWA.NaAc.5.4 TaxID=1434328 RepID=UPI000CB042E5|nr:hypothetical protein [Petrotoga sp. 9PWA.NaAc.5.4]PNR97187.1 hypothetical protein X924_00215 [Petrotoga sp. 9PWA.NaAc.5.4]
MSSVRINKLFKDGIVPTQKPGVLIDMKSDNYDCVYIDNKNIGKIAAEIIIESSNKKFIIKIDLKKYVSCIKQISYLKGV